MQAQALRDPNGRAEPVPGRRFHVRLEQKHAVEQRTGSVIDRVLVLPRVDQRARSIDIDLPSLDPVVGVAPAEDASARQHREERGAPGGRNALERLGLVDGFARAVEGGPVEDGEDRLHGGAEAVEEPLGHVARRQRRQRPRVGRLQTVLSLKGRRSEDAAAVLLDLSSELRKVLRHHRTRSSAALSREARGLRA